MKTHKRTMPVKRAKMALTEAALDLREEHDLTDVEYLQWLAEEQETTLKYMLRMERHGTTDKPAEQA